MNTEEIEKTDFEALMASVTMAEQAAVGALIDDQDENMYADMAAMASVVAKTRLGHDVPIEDFDNATTGEVLQVVKTALKQQPEAPKSDALQALLTEVETRAGDEGKDD